MSKNNSPMQAIRKKCIDCTCNKPIEIKACSVLDCPLWMFRLGINPNCGNHGKNPFLEASNFKGKQNMKASDLIKLIEKRIENNGSNKTTTKSRI